MMAEGFLPVSREDMEKQHIDQLDFVYVIGDAYVDHPSFGHAIISRVLQATALRWALSPSRTGKRTGALPFWGGRALPF